MERERKGVLVSRVNLIMNKQDFIEYIFEQTKLPTEVKDEICRMYVRDLKETAERYLNLWQEAISSIGGTYGQS